MRTKYYTLLLIWSLLVIGGCRGGALHRPYLTAQSTPRRDTYAAQRLNEEALRLIEAGEDGSAESRLREALEADLFYAPAHNNLGMLLLPAGKLYDAAWECQFAAKLFPHAVEPRNNLGLVMEKAAFLEEAVEPYQKALEIDAENVEVMGHLARVYIKSHKQPEDLRKFLKRLSFQNPGGTWDRWARRQLLALDAKK